MRKYKAELIKGMQQLTSPVVIDQLFFRENILLCNELLNGLHKVCESLPKDDKTFMGVLYDYCTSVLEGSTNNTNECIRSKNIKSLMHQYYTSVKGWMGNTEQLEKATTTLVMNISMLPKEEVN